MGGLQYAGFIIPVLILLVLGEWLISRKKGMNVYSLSDTLVNLSCGMLERLFDFFWIILLYFLFDFLFEHVAPWHLPNNAFIWIIGLFAGDFLAYWHHRLSHEINLFWAAHIVHHQSEELNMSTVFRVSAFAVINRSLFWIWMPIVGFSPEITTSIIVFIGLFQFVTHTRLVGKLGFLEKIFVTPSHHRVHHSRNEKYLDTNYGHVFIIWDKLLGTFKEEEEEPEYGITTGFNSANPFRAHLHYWADLFRRGHLANKISEKIAVFFKPPTYTPQGVPFMSPEYPTDENGNRLKQKTIVPSRLQIYVLINILVALGFLIVLFSMKKQIESPRLSDLLNNDTIMFLSTLISVTLLTTGMLMDMKRSAFVIEISRVFVVYTSLLILFPVLRENLFYLSGLTLAHVLLAFWLFSLRKFFFVKTTRHIQREIA